MKLFHQSTPPPPRIGTTQYTKQIIIHINIQINWLTRSVPPSYESHSPASVFRLLSLAETEETTTSTHNLRLANNSTGEPELTPNWLHSSVPGIQLLQWYSPSILPGTHSSSGSRKMPQLCISATFAHSKCWWKTCEETVWVQSIFQLCLRNSLPLLLRALKNAPLMDWLLGSPLTRPSSFCWFSCTEFFFCWGNYWAKRLLCALSIMNIWTMEHSKQSTLITSIKRTASLHKNCMGCDEVHLYHTHSIINSLRVTMNWVIGSSWLSEQRLLWKINTRKTTCFLIYRYI